MWEARSLWTTWGPLCLKRNEFSTPIRSSFLSFLKLLWILIRYSILLRLSSRMPSMRRRAYVTSLSSLLTLLTISKNNLMYSSAVSFYWAFSQTFPYLRNCFPLLIVRHVKECLELGIWPIRENFRIYRKNYYETLRKWNMEEHLYLERSYDFFYLYLLSYDWSEGEKFMKSFFSSGW